MKNTDVWQPSKFLPDGKQGRWKPNPDQMHPSSLYYTSAIIDTYLRVIRQYASGDLLDCGCGHVPFYTVYKDQVASITCIDWANSLHQNQFLDVVADLNQPFPLESNAYDTVLATDVMEHIARPWAFFGEIHRVLKPGGKVLLMVPFYFNIHEEPHDYYRYTEYALRLFCADHQMEVLEVTPLGGYPDVLIHTVYRGFIRNRSLSKAVLPLFKTLRRWSFFQRWNRKTAGHYPLGYALVAEKIVETL